MVEESQRVGAGKGLVGWEGLAEGEQAEEFLPWELFSVFLIRTHSRNLPSAPSSSCCSSSCASSSSAPSVRGSSAASEIESSAVCSGLGMKRERTAIR